MKTVKKVAVKIESEKPFEIALPRGSEILSLHVKPACLSFVIVCDAEEEELTRRRFQLVRTNAVVQEEVKKALGTLRFPSVEQGKFHERHLFELETRKPAAKPTPNPPRKAPNSPTPNSQPPAPAQAKLPVREWPDKRLNQGIGYHLKRLGIVDRAMRHEYYAMANSFEPVDDINVLHRQLRERLYNTIKLWPEGFNVYEGFRAMFIEKTPLTAVGAAS